MEADYTCNDQYEEKQDVERTALETENVGGCQLLGWPLQRTAVAFGGDKAKSPASDEKIAQCAYSRCGHNFNGRFTANPRRGKVISPWTKQTTVIPRFSPLSKGVKICMNRGRLILAFLLILLTSGRATPFTSIERLGVVSSPTPP